MNGSRFLLLFVIMTWPVCLYALIEFRRRLSTWLWLEGQWEERKRLLALGRKRQKAPDERQILLFPTLKPVKGDHAEQKVKVWS